MLSGLASTWFCKAIIYSDVMTADFLFSLFLHENRNIDVAKRRKQFLIIIQKYVSKLLLCFFVVFYILANNFL